MTHHPLVIGQLNDGMEPGFPGSDVAELAKYTQLQIDVELTDPLRDLLPPNYITIQGAKGTDEFSKGVAIMPDLMDISTPFWVPMSNKNNALVVRTKFKGKTFSLIAAKRPIAEHPDNVAAFDKSLISLWHTERVVGSVPIVGIDVNDKNPSALYLALNARWIRPFNVSICGFLLPMGVDVYGCVSLPKPGEHPPVIALTKVPVA